MYFCILTWAAKSVNTTTPDPFQGSDARPGIAYKVNEFLFSMQKDFSHLHLFRISRGDDVIKWKHFPRYWPFVRVIDRSPVNSPHKGQWRGALMFSVICARKNGCVNKRETGDLRRYCAHHNVIVMNLESVNIFWRFLKKQQDTFFRNVYANAALPIDKTMNVSNHTSHHLSWSWTP